MICGEKGGGKLFSYGFPDRLTTGAVVFFLAFLCSYFYFVLFYFSCFFFNRMFDVLLILLFGGIIFFRIRFLFLYRFFVFIIVARSTSFFYILGTSLLTEVFFNVGGNVYT